MHLIHPDCPQLYPLLSASHTCKPSSLRYIHVLFFCFVYNGVRSEMSEWPWVWSYCFEPGGLISGLNWRKWLAIPQEPSVVNSLPGKGTAPWTPPLPMNRCYHVHSCANPVQVALTASVISRPEVGDLPFSPSSGSYSLSSLSSTMVFEP